LPQRLQNIDDVRWLALLRRLNPLAGLLFLKQLFDCMILLVLEFIGVELTCLRLNDMGGAVQHIFVILGGECRRNTHLLSQHLGIAERDTSSIRAKKRAPR
jgi:hypothetical protein